MRPLWLAIPFMLAIGVACGGGDAATTTPAPSSTASFDATVEPTASGTPTDDLCAVLSAGDVLQTTGHELLEAQIHNGPGPLHFCTIYLDIPGCEMLCALSLEDLGDVDAANSNTPDAFRDSLTAANPDADFTFRDGVFGPDSWLATAQGGELPQWKVAYFQVKDIAYDLHSPLVPEYVLTEQQVIDVTNAAIANLDQ